MLKNAEKNRIKQEEFFRMEVRKMISPPEEIMSGYQKTWKFVNTPFALWLFSSVLLTVCTGFVTWYVNNNKIEQERIQNIQELTTEVTYRISRLNSYIESKYKLYKGGIYDNEWAPSPEKNNNNLKPLSYSPRPIVPHSTLNEYYEILRSVDSQGVFKEYSDRQLRSLLWELASFYDSDTQKQKDIKSAFDASLRLQRHVDALTKRMERISKDKAYVVLPEDFIKDLDKVNSEIVTDLTRITKELR